MGPDRVTAAAHEVAAFDERFLALTGEHEAEGRAGSEQQRPLAIASQRDLSAELPACASERDERAPLRSARQHPDGVVVEETRAVRVIAGPNRSRVGGRADFDVPGTVCEQQALASR